jgi:hypothetical protein
LGNFFAVFSQVGGAVPTEAETSEIVVGVIENSSEGFRRAVKCSSREAEACMMMADTRRTAGNALIV